MTHRVILNPKDLSSLDTIALYKGEYMATIAQLTNKQAQDFADKIGEIFKSVPHLPKEWVAFIVKYLPILAIIGAVLSLLSGLSVAMAGLYGMISAVFALATAALLFMAYKPLQDKKYDGWMLLFWSNVVSAVEALVMIVLSGQFFGIVGIIIGFYVLYELRPSYRGKVEALKAEVTKLTE